MLLLHAGVLTVKNVVASTNKQLLHLMVAHYLVPTNNPASILDVVEMGNI